MLQFFKINNFFSRLDHSRICSYPILKSHNQILNKLPSLLKLPKQQQKNDEHHRGDHRKSTKDKSSKKKKNNNDDNGSGGLLQPIIQDIQGWIKRKTPKPQVSQS